MSEMRDFLPADRSLYKNAQFYNKGPRPTEVELDFEELNEEISKIIDGNPFTAYSGEIFSLASNNVKREYNSSFNMIKTNKWEVQKNRTKSYTMPKESIQLKNFDKSVLKMPMFKQHKANSEKLIESKFGNQNFQNFYDNEIWDVGPSEEYNYKVFPFSTQHSPNLIMGRKMYTHNTVPDFSYHPNSPMNQQSQRFFNYSSNRGIPYMPETSDEMPMRQTTHNNMFGNLCENPTFHSGLQGSFYEPNVKSNFRNKNKKDFKKNHKNNNNPMDFIRNLDNKVKTNRDKLDDEQYRISLENVLKGKDKRTTIMIRHIPNKYTISSILEEINCEFLNKYDLFYLPLDYENNCNLGFAFINLIDPMHVILFYSVFRGNKWKKFNSEKICELAYAKFQGKKDLVAHFERGSVLNLTNDYKKPLILTTPNPIPSVDIPIVKLCLKF